MKVLVKWTTYRASQPGEWKIAEPRRTNNRSWEYGEYDNGGKPAFRVVRKTGAVEILTDPNYPQHAPQVVTTKEEWEQAHQPDRWKVEQFLKGLPCEKQLELAKLAGMEVTVPPYPLDDDGQAPTP